MKSSASSLSVSIATIFLSVGAHAAMIGYSENFNGVPIGNNVPPGFTEGGTQGTTTAGNSDAITVVDKGAGDNAYRFAVTGASAAYSGVALTGAAGNPFSVSIEFTIDSLTAGGGGSTALTINLVALGVTADLTGGTGNGNYRLGVNPSTSLSNGGKLVLSETGGSTGLTSNAGLGGGTGTDTITSVDTLGLVVGTTYTLSLQGSYTGSTINLSGALSGGATTLTVGATDASPRAGTFFGPRLASNSSSNTATVTFDNLTSVPETGAAMSLLGGVGMLLSLGRRRSR